MFHHMLDQWDLADHPLGSVLGVLQLALTIWMLVDAYHRGVEYFWYWIILFFQPIGVWVYFFAVKIRDFRPRRIGAGSATPLFQRRLSLKELRYRADRAPTVVNRLALAERLMEAGDHAEAIPHLEAVLAMDQNYGQALHDLAVCHLATGQPDRAVPVLGRLMDRDRRWSNYRAWHTLIEVHDARNRPDEALEASRELAKMVPTLENKCHLAERLIDAGQRAEAVTLLDQALEDHHYAPLGSRWRNWRWARAAQRLLKEAEAG